MNREDFDIQMKVIERAKKAKLFPNAACKDQMTLACDLGYAGECNGKKLDFKNLMSFDDANFAHDIIGISQHINRNRGESMGNMEDCFEPRCGWVER